MRFLLLGPDLLVLFFVVVLDESVLVAVVLDHVEQHHPEVEVVLVVAVDSHEHGVLEDLLQVLVEAQGRT